MRRTSLALLFLALLSLSENKLLAQTVSFDDAREKWRLATTYMREGAPRKALPLLEYLTSIAPANTEVRLELGRVDKRGFTWRADRDSSWYLRWRPAWHET